mgnify:CR=1 FL=1|tara:strand:- start:158 stop:613 length:456 start_codon:yes stop_codon:yes gene_type:complete
MNKINGIWFCGLSGSGKSYGSRYLEKRIKNSIKIEGDTVRKFINYDLGYTKKDRIKSALTNLRIAQLLIHEKKFPIISNVYIDNKVIMLAKKNKIKVIKVIRKKLTNIKFDKKTKDVVGRDIKFKELKCSKLLNDNNFENKLLNLIRRYSL